MKITNSTLLILLEVPDNNQLTFNTTQVDTKTKWAIPIKIDFSNQMKQHPYMEEAQMISWTFIPKIYLLKCYQ